MNDISIDNILNRIEQFCKDRNWDQFHTPKELAIGAVTEAAELLDLFRFLSDQQIEDMLTDENGRAKIGQELADILYFLLRFSQLYGFDLLEEVDKNMSINEAKYPVKLSRDCNLKYNELTEK